MLALFARGFGPVRRYTLPWDEAKARRLWGRMLLAAGGQGRAAEEFEAAAAIYRRIGAAERWLEPVEQERGRPLRGG